MDQDLSHYRRQYEKGELDESSVPENPMELFRDWFFRAERDENCVEPNAMQLATLGRDGFPGIRTVLLKRFRWDGFIFYTNYRSAKGMDIEKDPHVSLHFYWPVLERQVIVKGLAEKLPPNLSDGYFALRPRGSRIGAWASEQSKPIPSKDFLEKRFREFELQFRNADIPRPPYWGGYIVKPSKIEFWQGRPNRLHDRILYELQADWTWKITRLSP